MASRPPFRFDPNGMLRRLAAHEVQFVVVGGVGARLLGSPMMTQDVDIVPETSPANHERLAAALSGPLTSKLVPTFRKPQPHRTVDADEFDTDGILTYFTEFGRIDVLPEIPVAGGYVELLSSARTFDLDDGVVVQVADLEAIIKSKEAVGRPKDLQALSGLYQLRLEEAGERGPFLDDEVDDER